MSAVLLALRLFIESLARSCMLHAGCWSDGRGPTALYTRILNREWIRLKLDMENKNLVTEKRSSRQSSPHPIFPFSHFPIFALLRRCIVLWYCDHDTATCGFISFVSIYTPSVAKPQPLR